MLKNTTFFCDLFRKVKHFRYSSLIKCFKHLSYSNFDNYSLRLKNIEEAVSQNVLVSQFKVDWITIYAFINPMNHSASVYKTPNHREDCWLESWSENTYGHHLFGEKDTGSHCWRLTVYRGFYQDIFIESWLEKIWWWLIQESEEVSQRVDLDSRFCNLCYLAQMSPGNSIPIMHY